MSACISSTPSLQKAGEIINKLDPSKFPLLLHRITQTMQQGTSIEKPFTEAELNKLQTSLSLDRQELKLLLDSITFIIDQAAYHMTKPGVLHRQLLDVLKLDEDKAEALVTVWASAAKGIVEQLRQKSVFPSQMSSICRLNDEEKSHPLERRNCRSLHSPCLFLAPFPPAPPPSLPCLIHFLGARGQAQVLWLEFASIGTHYNTGFRELEDVGWALNIETASYLCNKQKELKAVLQFGLKSNLKEVNSKENLIVEFNHGELYEFYKQLEKIQTQLDSLR
uniref:COMM domain-containing protein n=1 Tax=Timema tahoe TaxID=61484 RepID=A0A7R9IGQ6_9NEOP|nr:unnamed protein product [Timema tahoe]